MIFRDTEEYRRKILLAGMGYRQKQIISNTGFESPCSTKGESYRFSPLDTPSALCPPQEARFTLNLMSGIEVEEKVEMGAPDKNIVKLAETWGADLIVISTHGRTGLSRMFTGSVTENVVRHALCPVLSIHPDLKYAQREKFTAINQEANTLV